MNGQLNRKTGYHHHRRRHRRHHHIAIPFCYAGTRGSCINGIQREIESKRARKKTKHSQKHYNATCTIHGKRAPRVWTIHHHVVSLSWSLGGMHTTRAHVFVAATEVCGCVSVHSNRHLFHSLALCRFAVSVCVFVSAGARMAGGPYHETAIRAPQHERALHSYAMEVLNNSDIRYEVTVCRLPAQRQTDRLAGPACACDKPTRRRTIIRLRQGPVVMVVVPLPNALD